MLGQTCFDDASSTNESVMMLTAPEAAPYLSRNHFVRIRDAMQESREFLGRVLAGPFFHPMGNPGDNGVEGNGVATRTFADRAVHSRIEIQGELVNGQLRDTNIRPAPGSIVEELSAEEVSKLLRLAGDMRVGSLFGYDEVWVELKSDAKAVLPRNLGIFGTVGSGKSNTAQVFIEEVSQAGWAVVVVDVEGEYAEMNQPTIEDRLVPSLQRFGREPRGIEDFAVYYPMGTECDAPNAQPFTLRAADYDPQVLAEILGALPPERNALMDVIDHLRRKFKTKLISSEDEEFAGLLDATPKAALPYRMANLIDRSTDRGPHTSPTADYLGLTSKLTRLNRSGAFDVTNCVAIDPGQLLVPGRVTVFDVSMASDHVKNMVTADLLRKIFAFKVAKSGTARTLVLIEEAHSFISRERSQSMNATIEMLRDISRRGRKRWLSLGFVSQQPGHLPPEIFELCNTRVVHNIKSLHNLQALMIAAEDVSQEIWAKCPLLGVGQAIVSSPQFKHPVLANLRPAAVKRKFVD